MGRERVIPAQNWIELERLLQVRPATVALIDPSADGADRTTEFERIKAAFPSLPIIAYVPLTASAFRAVAQLSRLGLEHVLLYSHDDSAERMRSTIGEVRASPLTARFVREIRPRLERLPVSISNAVE